MSVEILTLTPSEMYCHQTELARERQRRYYANNKEKILSRKRQERTEFRLLRNGQMPLPVPFNNQDQQDVDFALGNIDAMQLQKEKQQAAAAEDNTMDDMETDPGPADFEKTPKQTWTWPKIEAVLDKLFSYKKKNDAGKMEGVNGPLNQQGSPSKLVNKKSAIKLFLEGAECKHRDLQTCLKDFAYVKEKIDQQRVEQGQRQGELWSPNTRKSRVNEYLWMIDAGHKYFPGLEVDKGTNSNKKSHTAGGIPLKLYQDWANSLKIEAGENAGKKDDKVEYLPMTTILKMTKETFAEASKEYLLMRMYYDIPVRDDFALYYITEEAYKKEQRKARAQRDDEDFDKKNYLIKLTNGGYAAAFYSFKTAKNDRYEPGKVETFSKETNKLLKAFVEKDDLKLGKRLFGMKGKSSSVERAGTSNYAIIKKILATIFEKYKVGKVDLESEEKEDGVQMEKGSGAINYLRHARASEAGKDWDKRTLKYANNQKELEKVRQERVELANRMKHSTETQKKTYIRNVDPRDYDV